MELEIRPVFLVPDTNGFIDHLGSLVTLLDCRKFILVVPLIGERGQHEAGGLLYPPGWAPPRASSLSAAPRARRACVVRSWAARAALSRAVTVLHRAWARALGFCLLFYLLAGAVSRPGSSRRSFSPCFAAPLPASSLPAALPRLRSPWCALRGCQGPGEACGC